MLRAVAVSVTLGLLVGGTAYATVIGANGGERPLAGATSADETRAVTPLVPSVTQSIGDAEFSLSTFTNARGKRCVSLARPGATSVSCTSKKTVHLVIEKLGDQSLAYGLTTPGARVRLILSDCSTTEVPVGRGGGFLKVLDSAAVASRARPFQLLVADAAGHVIDRVAPGRPPRGGDATGVPLSGSCESAGSA